MIKFSKNFECPKCDFSIETGELYTEYIKEEKPYISFTGWTKHIKEHLKVQCPHYRNGTKK